MNLDGLFNTLGFDPTQALVYQSLTELGRASPSALAKQLRIPRTSAYYALDMLAKQGLIAKEEDKGRLMYAAKDPKHLRLLVDRERSLLTEKETAAAELEKQLRSSFKGGMLRMPRMRFCGSTKEVEELLYSEIDKWHESMAEHENIFWGFQDHSFVEEYPKWLEHHWRIRDESQEIRLFSNAAPIERKMQGKVDRRNIRPGPPQLRFDSTLWICGDYIIMLMTRRKPHYGYEIHDEVLAGTLRGVFRALWETW